MPIRATYSWQPVISLSLVSKYTFWHEMYWYWYLIYHKSWILRSKLLSPYFIIKSLLKSYFKFWTLISHIQIIDYTDIFVIKKYPDFTSNIISFNMIVAFLVMYLIRYSFNKLTGIKSRQGSKGVPLLILWILPSSIIPNVLFKNKST